MTTTNGSYGEKFVKQIIYIRVSVNAWQYYTECNTESAASEIAAQMNAKGRAVLVSENWLGGTVVR